MKVQTIKRPNGLWVAYEAGKKLMAQAKKKVGQSLCMQQDFII